MAVSGKENLVERILDTLKSVPPAQSTMVITGGIASLLNALPDRVVLILFDNVLKFRVALYDYRIAPVIVDKRIVFTQRQ